MKFEEKENWCKADGLPEEFSAGAEKVGNGFVWEVEYAPVGVHVTWSAYGKASTMKVAQSNIEAVFARFQLVKTMLGGK